MEILEGDLDVLLPDAADWVKVQGGESFEVPAQATFSIRVWALTDYCCSFLSRSGRAWRIWGFRLNRARNEMLTFEGARRLV
jgi:hypothetical protein